MRLRRAFALLLVLLCTHVLDVALHQYVTEGVRVSCSAGDDTFAEDSAPGKPNPQSSLHAALHCAGHTIASVQKLTKAPFSSLASSPQFPFVWNTFGSSRILSPPVPPPLA